MPSEPHRIRLKRVDRSRSPRFGIEIRPADRSRPNRGRRQKRLSCILAMKLRFAVRREAAAIGSYQPYSGWASGQDPSASLANTNSISASSNLSMSLTAMQPRPKAVELIRAGQGELLMKGSLHTDELMRPVTASATGLRTERRISHVFIMDVPTYPETLFITDAAINIFPDLDAKRDIVQNAIDLFTQIGLGKPRVAILSAVETVTTKIPSTIDAAALCKMADRGQITGAILDGPLAFDNAIDPEAARIKGIHSPVAGRAQILVVPDLEAGNMLAKNLDLSVKGGLGGPGPRCARAHRADVACGLCAQPHGVVRRRRALCRGAAQIRKHSGGVSRSWMRFWSSTPGSSSVKFQIFGLPEREDPPRLIKGQVDGIGTRPRLRAEGRDGSPLIDESYAPGEIDDVPAAIAAAADWLRETPDRRIGRRRPSRGSRRSGLRPARCRRPRRAGSAWSDTVSLAPLHQPNNLAPIRSLLHASAGASAGRLFRYGVSSHAQRRRRPLCHPRAFLSRGRQAIRISRTLV